MNRCSPILVDDKTCRFARKKATSTTGFWSPHEKYVLYFADTKSALDSLEEHEDCIFGRCMICGELMLVKYNDTGPIGRLIIVCPKCRDKEIEKYQRKGSHGV